MVSCSYNLQIHFSVSQLTIPGRPSPEPFLMVVLTGNQIPKLVLSSPSLNFICEPLQKFSRGLLILHQNLLVRPVWQFRRRRFFFGVDPLIPVLDGNQPCYPLSSNLQEIWCQIKSCITFFLMRMYMSQQYQQYQQ